MSRWHAYLNTGKKIIEAYDGHMPLSVWLKNFFRQHKQMGSQDRKHVTELVYGFYRLGHAARQLTVEERMLTAVFLCNAAPHPLLHNLKPEWNAAIELSLSEKSGIVHQVFGDWHPDHIFPWKEALSDHMDADSFTGSFLQQPDLFLRMRPGKEKMVMQKLAAAGISFRQLMGSCLALPNATRIDGILMLDKEAVVQDYSSQRTGEMIRLLQADTHHPALWDCCAASGGKSIMAYDLIPGIHLTVSDVRESILYNLRQRFKKAGIDNYQAFVGDISRPGAAAVHPRPDIIIADLPCTGSGTWARTPEQLYFFDPAKPDYYSNLQKDILCNILPGLKAGGQLVYITCSVFRKENEEVVRFIKERFDVRLAAMQLLEGYTMKADTLFAARFEL